MIEVGTPEAKAHLPRLLAAGQIITITKRGKPVARIIPADPSPANRADLVTALKSSRRGVRPLVEQGRR